MLIVETDHGCDRVSVSGLPASSEEGAGSPSSSTFLIPSDRDRWLPENQTKIASPKTKLSWDDLTKPARSHQGSVNFVECEILMSAKATFSGAGLLRLDDNVPFCPR